MGGGGAGTNSTSYFLEAHISTVVLTGVLVLLQGRATGVRPHLDRKVDAVDCGDIVVVYTRINL